MNKKQEYLRVQFIDRDLWQGHWLLVEMKPQIPVKAYSLYIMEYLNKNNRLVLIWILQQYWCF